MRNSNDFNAINNPLEIRCKCPGDKLPKYVHAGDAGADLRADIPDALTIWPHESVWIDTGVCVEIPNGYVGLQFARSGMGMKHNVCLANGVGVIDSGYRGRIRAKLINLGDKPYTVHPGDRVCQLVIVPFATCSYIQVDELNESERGANGYGSTGVD